MWWEEFRSEALFQVVLAALGAIAGSFSSAAIHRLPDDELSLFHPRRSFCPSCRYQLRWFDNLPILSYVMLGGRCRKCRTKLGVSYLFNELALLGLFLVAGQTWAAERPLSLVLVLVVLTALWIATVVDWRHLILPDEITLGGIPFGILASVLVPQFQGIEPGMESAPFPLAWFGLDPTLSPALLAGIASVSSAALAFLLMFGLGALFSYLLGQEALGFGDVKFLAAVGALIGLEGALLTLLIGVFVGAVLGVLNIVRMVAVVARRRRERGRSKSFGDTLRTGWLLGRRIPFGPPLVLGTMLILLAPAAARAFFFETWPELLRGLLK